MDSSEKLSILSKAVVTGKTEAQKLAQEVLSEQIPIDMIFKEALIPAMKTLGEGMKEEEYGFPEIQSSIKALRSVMEVLKPAFQNQIPSSGTIPKWSGTGELYELGGHLLNFLDKGIALQGYDLILFFDECIRGLLEQIDLPCHKQAESTHE